MKQQSIQAALVTVLLATILTAPTTMAQSDGAGSSLDSDHLIFVVDTSGSMRRYEWTRVQEQIRQTLGAHQSLQGIQVLNDEGNELLADFRNQWIPATPGNINAVLSQLEDWDSFSNSSPRRGIVEAISRYYEPDKEISLYVMSDDFASGTMDAVIAEVNARNQTAGPSGPLVRINAVAFPVYWDVTGEIGTGGDFAMLMHRIAGQNDGSFVGLSPNGAPGNREPVTGLRLPEQRSLILVDASSNIAGDQWSRVVDSTRWLVARLEPGSEFQLVTFGEDVRYLAEDSASDWLASDNAERTAQLLEALGELNRSGSADLMAAFDTIDQFETRPDNVYLLVDGMPDLSMAENLPNDVPINVLLFGSDPDSLAAPNYWAMALTTGGSLVAPAGDWP